MSPGVTSNGVAFDVPARALQLSLALRSRSPRRLKLRGRALGWREAYKRSLFC